MANYRRNFLPGGSYFFTVNLADRRRALLTDHVDLLRAAFRQVRARHPFAIEPAAILPDTSTRSGPCLMAMRISPPAGA
jgi:putative transposase